MRIVQFVDDVLIDAPYDISEEMIDRLHISTVVCGSVRPQVRTQARPLSSCSLCVCVSLSLSIFLPFSASLSRCLSPSMSLSVNRMSSVGNVTRMRCPARKEFLRSVRAREHWLVDIHLSDRVKHANYLLSLSNLFLLLLQFSILSSVFSSSATDSKWSKLVLKYYFIIYYCTVSWFG